MRTDYLPLRPVLALMLYLLRWICWTLAALLFLVAIMFYLDSPSQRGQAMPLDWLFALMFAAAAAVFGLIGWAC